MTEPILVTGGAGYIGSHVVRDLGEKGGYHPVVYDNLSTGNREQVLCGEFIEGDTGDEQKLRETIVRKGIRQVIHFAASIMVPESVRNPLKYYQNNTANSISLLRACISGGVKHFVFSSTAAVYGIPAQIPVPESASPSPINPYGMSKLCTENILRDAARANPSFNFIALRYFNVAGADEKVRIGQKYPQPTHLITLGLKTALGQFPHLNIYGSDYDTADGTAVRDYIHVDDLSDAHLLALKHLKESGQSGIYNCGYQQGFSVREVIHRIKEVTGRDFSVKTAARRAGDPPMLVAATERIRRDLHWFPRKNDLDRILKSAWEWEKKIHSAGS